MAHLKHRNHGLPPPEEVRHLSALLRRRDALVTDSTHEKTGWKSTRQQPPPVTAESVEAMTGQLNAEIKRPDTLNRSRLNQHPELKKDFDLLTSIKSVGYQSGLNMIVILRSHDFATAEQVLHFWVSFPLKNIPAPRSEGVRDCQKSVRRKSGRNCICTALSGEALFCPSFSLQHQQWLLSEVIPDTQYSFRIRLKVTIKTAVYFCLH